MGGFEPAAIAVLDLPGLAFRLPAGKAICPRGPRIAGEASAHGSRWRSVQQAGVAEAAGCRLLDIGVGIRTPLASQYAWIHV